MARSKSKPREGASNLPIQPVATSTTAFLGVATRGPMNKATQVKSLAAFKRRFGNLRDDFELGHAIAQFFRNGGSNAWVVRIPSLTTSLEIKKAPKKQQAGSPLAESGKMPNFRSAGLAALNAVDLINLLVLPGLYSPEWIDAALDYAIGRRAFVIVDPPKNAVTSTALLTKIAGRAFRNATNGAMFFPWLQIVNAARPKQMRLSAPSGTIAGLFARNDRNVGIWKAPAGKDATLDGVTALGCDLTQTEIDELHAHGINSLRKLPNDGFVSWSARTLASHDETQSEWKYIPLRRFALFIEETIARGTQWATFEPNSESLWARIRTNTEAFLQNLFEQGAFAGRTPKDAYFVKCDRTTMTQDDVDNGRLIILVGVALVRPAEFVIFRIGQWTCTQCDN